MNFFKNILKIITALILVAGMLFLFFFFTLPAIKQDRKQLVEQEMEVHNQTLEQIKQDFSYVLSDNNVSLQMGENISLTISGKYCKLEVELNRELKVLSLETVDKTEDAVAGYTFACIGEGIVVIFAIVVFCLTVGDIADDIKFAADRRKARKELRKKAKEKAVDVEVVV